MAGRRRSGARVVSCDECRDLYKTDGLEPPCAGCEFGQVLIDQDSMLACTLWMQLDRHRPYLPIPMGLAGVTMQPRPVDLQEAVALIGLNGGDARTLELIEVIDRIVLSEIVGSMRED